MIEKYVEKNPGPVKAVEVILTGRQGTISQIIALCEDNHNQIVVDTDKATIYFKDGGTLEIEPGDMFIKNGGRYSALPKVTFRKQYKKYLKK